MEPTGITIVSALKKAVLRAARHYRHEEATTICYLLFEEIVGYSRIEIHSNPGILLEPVAAARLDAALDSLESGMPVQYITGIAWFGSLRITVNQDVLIPRQETAELPGFIDEEVIRRKMMPKRILDIGTGSGCIAVALALAYKHAEVFGVDISKSALDVASTNATQHNCTIHFVLGDILSGLPELPDVTFDIIVSNPPYVTESERPGMAPHVREFEPSIALFIPDSRPYIYYEAIARYAVTALADSGILFVEINERFGREICRIFSDAGLTDPRVICDLNGKERFVRAFSTRF